ncbi:MAG: ABC-F family ATP-binding cassette domain-containing protein [Ruminococcaceae bacterium]|nr:ABC-F family ATP-binding cassette domain-containing protein [Oscillospiraceae bacterium]
MARLAVHGLDKYIGERALFTDLSFEIGERDRIGLVGDNGCGKTTLLRILMGEERPDGGEAVRFRDTRIGYMEQHTCREAQRTLWDEVESVFAPLMALELELGQVNAALAAGEPTPALLERQHTLRERFEAAGGLYYKSRVRATLLGLGFPESAFTTPVGVLSGGQRSKAAMGRLLLADTNLLLLDEPTNHLDIPSVEWLEEYLQSYTGAVVVISHDRYFLDKVTNRTMELKNGRLYVTNGNYSVHKEKRDKDKEIERRHYDTAIQEIHRIEENITLLKQWNREKSIRAAESREKRVERLREDLVAPEEENKTIRFRFEANEVGGNEVLTAEDLQKGFGGDPLFSGVSLALQRGDRAFLLGPNGCGKTTLLRILCDRLSPDKGYVRLGAKVTVGYYDQVQQGVDSHKTALQELWDAYPTKTETELRSAMAAFLFRGDEVHKPVGVMSGGERARLLLLKLMLAGDNLLLLDEPTNHLDIASREALEEALESYDGTILAVSHDRYFINRMATRVLELRRGGMVPGGNDYDAYVAARQAHEEQLAAAQPATKPVRENDYKQRKERESARRRLQTAVRRAEEEVARLEGVIAMLEEQLADPAVATDYDRLASLTADLEQHNTALETAMTVWEETQQQWEDMTGE